MLLLGCRFCLLQVADRVAFDVSIAQARSNAARRLAAASAVNDELAAAAEDIPREILLQTKFGRSVLQQEAAFWLKVRCHCCSQQCVEGMVTNFRFLRPRIVTLFLNH